MAVISGQTVVCEFTTRNVSGGRQNFDAAPTGTLIVNGIDNAATVTITNIGTGRYKASVVLPTLALGDTVEINVLGTVSSVTDNSIIWRDTRQDACVGDLAVVPTNFSALSIDGSGRLDVAKYAGDAAAVAAHVAALKKVYVGTVTGSPTTTTFIDSAQTGGDDGWYNGRIILFGGLTIPFQGTLITGWNQSTKTYTFKALTRAPAVADPYVIV